MEITWLGHACFRIRGREGVVITDPYGQGSGFTMPKVQANVVTVSHDDPFHAAADAVGGTPRVIAGAGEYEVNNIPVVALRTFRDTDKGKTRGKNVIFRIDMEDISVVHLGALGHVPNEDVIEGLGSIGVLLIPVGGHGTLDSTMAAETIRLLQPSIVVPMHFKTGGEKDDLETAERFLKEMGAAEKEPLPRLQLTKSGLGDTTQVVVLNPA